MNEFEIYMTDEKIRHLPVNKFKQLVEEKSLSGSIKYLKMKQSKGEKDANIKYETLELQDYLNPYSNLSLKEQQHIFSLRTQMSPLRNNISKNYKFKIEICVNKCY